MNQLAQEEMPSTAVAAVALPDHNLVVPADRHASCRSSRTNQPTRTSSRYSPSVQDEEVDDDGDDDEEEDEEEEDDPVWVRNRYALELMRVGMYGRAASHLKEALQLVRMDNNKTNKKKKYRRAPSYTSAASATRTTSTSHSPVTMSLQPYPVGQGSAVATAVAAYHHREPLAFHPFLRGMELVEVAPPPGEDDDAASSLSSSSDYDAVTVAALCYNLGMVHQLMAIQLSHELHLQEQDVEGRRRNDGDDVSTTLRQRLQRRQQVVEGCFRKSLRFYELATATTAPLAVDRTANVSSSDDGVESMEEDESCFDDENDDDDCSMMEDDQPTTNDSSSSYLLLNVALWANMGHIHYCLGEAGHVRRCADQLCLALHDLDSVSSSATAAAPAPAPPATQPQNATTTTTTRSSSPVLLMPLAMNVLLYSQIRNPAPCA